MCLRSLFILFACIILNSCTKTKVGEYTMVLDGTFYGVQRNLSSTDTTGTYYMYPYHEELQIELNHVGNSYVEVAGDIWNKSGKSISFSSLYVDPADPVIGGATDSSSRRYNGTIISNTLMEGDFYLKDLTYATNPKPIMFSKTGRFTIRKK